MAITFKLYHDVSLTSEITSGNPLTCAQIAGASADAVDKVIYFGSTETGKKVQVDASPGVTPIQISVSDSASGSGAPASEIKLATSAPGLATAVAGAALGLTTSISSGVANAVPIHVRRDSALTVAGSYTDISLVTQTLIETPL